MGVDLTGPHPSSSKGNLYFVTIVDQFTKLIEHWLIPNQEASPSSRRSRLLYEWRADTTTYRQVVNFESGIFKEICSRWSVDKVRTSAKPSTNGNIERFHSTLNATLAKWVANDHRDWDKHLAAVAFVYRTSVQPIERLNALFPHLWERSTRSVRPYLRAAAYGSRQQ